MPDPIDPALIPAHVVAAYQRTPYLPGDKDREARQGIAAALDALAGFGLVRVPYRHEDGAADGTTTVDAADVLAVLLGAL